MDFGIILGDIPVTVSEKDHFYSILRQVEAAQRCYGSESPGPHVVTGTRD